MAEPVEPHDPEGHAHHHPTPGTTAHEHHDDTTVRHHHPNQSAAVVMDQALHDVQPVNVHDTMIQGTEVTHIANMDTPGTNGTSEHPQEQLNVELHTESQLPVPVHDQIHVDISIEAHAQASEHVQEHHQEMQSEIPHQHHPEIQHQHQEIQHDHQPEIQHQEIQHQHQHQHQPEIQHQEIQHEHTTMEMPGAPQSEAQTPQEDPVVNVNVTEDPTQLGMVAAPQALSWHDYFIALQAHANQYGTVEIPPGTNPGLEQWVIEQRGYYEEDKKGVETTLTGERKLLLDALGFKWEMSEDNVEMEVEVPDQVGATTTVMVDNVAPETTVNMGETLAAGSAPDPAPVPGMADVDVAMNLHPHAHTHTHTPTETPAPAEVAVDPNSMVLQQPEMTHVATPVTVSTPANPINDDVDTFNARLVQLANYKVVHGHVNVPETHEEDANLGMWVSVQRALFHKADLDQERINALLELGFSFELPAGVEVVQVQLPIQVPVQVPMQVQVADVEDGSSFEERINQLMQYKDVHGHVKVPREWGPEQPGLGEWLFGQIDLIRRWHSGEQTTMTPERQKMITDLGVIIELNVLPGTTHPSENHGQMDEDAMDAAEAERESNRASKWDEKYVELKNYKATHGHTNVPRRSKRDPSKDALGEWVHFQRRQHRNLLTGKNSTMSIARKKALDVLEFQWTRGGHGPNATTRTGTTYCTDIKEAVNVQIKHMEQREQLETWNERLGELETYVNTHGHANVPSDYRENPILAMWLHRQIELYQIWRVEAEHSAMISEQNPEMHQINEQQHSDDPSRFTKEKYDRLIALGFELDKPMNSSTVPMEGLEQVKGELDATNGGEYTTEPTPNMEERPTLEDDGDSIEIFIGWEEVPAQEEPQELAQQMENNHPAMATAPTDDHQEPVATPEGVAVMPPSLEHVTAATEPSPVDASAPKEMELNESDVNAILEGKEEHHPNPVQVPMPEIQNQTDEGMVEMKGVNRETVHNQKEQGTQETHMEHAVDASSALPQSQQRRITARVKVEWEERVLELIQFKLRKHHCNVPTKWKPNTGLADWVWRQRAQYRRYRQSQPSTLTASRISKLTDLGFEFVALDHNGIPIDEADSKLYSTSDLSKLQATKKNPKRKGTPKSRFKEGKWLESLAKVVKYKEEHGNCNVPRKWKRDPTLGEWVHFQRRQFRLRQLSRRNHMTDERIRKLEAIGFEWSRGTASQPSYIRLYEQNKEIVPQTGVLPGTPGEVGVEPAAMHTSEVPADVSQIAVLDGEEQVKAEEIAAVVEEQLKNPEDESHHQQVHHQQVGHHQQSHHEHFVEYPQAYDEHNLHHHRQYEREYENVQHADQLQAQQHQQMLEEQQVEAENLEHQQADHQMQEEHSQTIVTESHV